MYDLDPNTDDKNEEDIWKLRLYVAGKTAKSVKAFSNLKEICRKYLGGKCKIELCDVSTNPDVAKNYNIIATPTLVRILPGLHKKLIIGDLTNEEKVLSSLEILNS